MQWQNAMWLRRTHWPCGLSYSSAAISFLGSQVRTPLTQGHSSFGFVVCCVPVRRACHSFAGYLPSVSVILEPKQIFTLALNVIVAQQKESNPRIAFGVFFQLFYSAVLAKPSQAKPSQAKPSQAKPSQAKPSQAKVLTDGRELRAAQVDLPPSVQPFLRLIVSLGSVTDTLNSNWEVCLR